jgi:hypothetical protein
MLSVINMYISRDNGVEKRGGDTGTRAGERRRRDDIVVASQGA